MTRRGRGELHVVTASHGRQERYIHLYKQRKTRPICVVTFITFVIPTCQTCYWCFHMIVVFCMT